MEGHWCRTSRVLTRTHLHISHLLQVEGAIWLIRLKGGRQVDQYSHLEVSHFFAPVYVETSGAMGRDTLRLLREIAQRIVTRSGEPNAYQRLIQRISVAVPRGNTISIMGTFKPGSRSVSDSSNCSFD